LTNIDTRNGSTVKYRGKCLSWRILFTRYDHVTHRLVQRQRLRCFRCPGLPRGEPPSHNCISLLALLSVVLVADIIDKPRESVAVDKHTELCEWRTTWRSFMTSRRHCWSPSGVMVALTHREASCSQSFIFSLLKQIQNIQFQH